MIALLDGRQRASENVTRRRVGKAGRSDVLRLGKLDNSTSKIKNGTFSQRENVPFFLSTVEQSDRPSFFLIVHIHIMKHSRHIIIFLHFINQFHNFFHLFVGQFFGMTWNSLKTRT